MKVLGINITPDGICVSDGRSCNKPPYLVFLNNLREDNTILTFTNLDGCVAGLSRLVELAKEEAKDLIESRARMAHLGEFSVQYIPEKSFMIARGWYPGLYDIAHFSDISQYSLELSKYNGNNDSFYRARLAQEVGEEVYNILSKLDPNLRSLTSPVSSFKKSVFRNLEMPTLADYPMEAGWLANQCCKGGWTEAFTRGHFDEVLDYDINGAYAFQTSKLIDLRGGKWGQSTKQVHLDNAFYGYLEGIYETDSEFSPVILHRNGEANIDKNSNPKGTFPTCITLGMFRYINEKGLGKFTVQNGWFFYPDGSRPCPVSELAEQYYEMKQKASGLEREIIKTILEGGFYGLFLQHFGENPSKNLIYPYAAEIQTNTQIAVHRACLESNVVPLAVMTDGVTTTPDKPLNVTLSDKFGGWRLSNKDKALIIASQYQAIENKSTGKEFSLDYNWLVDYAKAHPEDKCFLLEKKACVSLPLAYSRGKLETAGEIVEETRRIYIIDNKREWVSKPNNLSELVSGQFQSKAHDANLLLAMRKLTEGGKYSELIEMEK